MGCLKLSKHKKVVKVEKMDGKVMEFKAPILARELLVKFEGFGVKSSRNSLEAELPPSYELQLGKIYYLFPCKRSAAAAADGVSTAAAVKRIKVVITKKQLEELLSKKISVEKMMFGIDDKGCCLNDDLVTNWKPNLLPIPEDYEFINM